MLYSINPKNLFVLDHRKDQFDLWNNRSPIGGNFLILEEPSHNREFNCQRESALGEMNVEWQAATLQNFNALICYDFSWKINP
jgi:hypothetical protein